jgi:methylthioribose-1-phosphate isomerase
VDFIFTFCYFMLVNGKSYQTIWLNPEDDKVFSAIDQRYLPFEFRVEEFKTIEDIFFAIREMHVRGAPLIGAAASAGIYLSLFNFSDSDNPYEYIRQKAEFLKSARPTAINLAMAVDRQVKVLAGINSKEELIFKARTEWQKLIDEEIDNSRKIGTFGLPLLEKISREKDGLPVNILTHCNAGWLACIDYGTATAPVYLANEADIPVHLWVSETRPRLQGARLTCWELREQGVPYTLITDNAAGFLMQNKMVDIVIVGSDRTAVNGDVANKIGTYLKAVAAKDNGIPFYVALPSTSIDWKIQTGKDIPIEERDENEVRFAEGMVRAKPSRVRIAPLHSMTYNPAFDITPAHLITGLITERGICEASREGITGLFPDLVSGKDTGY